MIQIFQTDGKKVIEHKCEFNGGMNLKNKWIHLENPTDREIEFIERVTGVEGDMLKAALDEEERARIEVDDGNTLVLFDIATIEDEEGYFSYSTMPLGIILTPSCIITVCLKENSVIHTMAYNRIKNIDTYNCMRFLYQLLYSTHVKFIQYLKQIERSSQRVKGELNRSTKNKELLQLLDLENSLVYFSTSLKANSIIIERLVRMDDLSDKENSELLEDAQIENRQAVEVCKIYRDIIAGTSDAYASVISNNLNMIMKVLTALTVVISIPTLIASFWGMNTWVPWEGQKHGFWIVTAVAVIAALISGYYLMRNKNLSATEKKRRLRDRFKRKK